VARNDLHDRGKCATEKSPCQTACSDPQIPPPHRPRRATPFPCTCCRLSSCRLNLNLLFACGQPGVGKPDSKTEGWEESNQTKEMVTKRVLYAVSVVSTSVASAMMQCDDQPTPKVTSQQKRRATERQACVCESSTSFPARTEVDHIHGQAGAKEKEDCRCPGPAVAATSPRGCCRPSCWRLNLNFLFAYCKAGF